MSFRDGIRTISPPWLQNGYGERFLYASALQVDAIAEAARQGVRARAPGAPGTPSDALLQLGRDRVMSRGQYESDESFAERLSGAFESWQRGASLEGLMRALQALLRDADTQVRGITWWALWALIPSWEAPIEYTFGARDAWHWGEQIGGGGFENAYFDWARAYVVIYPSTPGQWEQATLGSGLVLGSGAWSVGVAEPPEVVQAARLVADQWRSAATNVRVIVSWDAAWPSHPTGPADLYQQADLPWRTNHTIDGFGVAVPSRYLGAAYLDPVA